MTGTQLLLSHAGIFIAGLLTGLGYNARIGRKRDEQLAAIWQDAINTERAKTEQALGIIDRLTRKDVTDE